MLDKLRRFFKKDEQSKLVDKYNLVPKNGMNEGLKRNIIELEQLGEECSKVLQKKYESVFEIQEKPNLRIWICRDIDGDEVKCLTSGKCLEKEYRSQIAIDYDRPKFEDEFYADTIELWYYFGGYSEGSGTLYDIQKMT